MQDANVNGMELREGRGNELESSRPREEDVFNVVWVVDSNSLPFYRAERYHQFHNGMGKAFPEVRVHMKHMEYIHACRDQCAVTWGRWSSRLYACRDVQTHGARRSWRCALA